ncbi:uncharacterized protein LOC133531544 [Cydia pomonella]|uniref:uncharacterized protein LOC133531544 n=1 Tax=Cydia pomonella TaxID=82600 RepID=UPI002ADD9432|nr:uncharacterized protein LOC133531544 [Cydia pomonella]
MSELTVHSVCTKGPIYPTLLYFQNGCLTKDFETDCAVLQDKNKTRTIVMETSELVYAGKEEKEESGMTLILARDRVSGNVRLIEVGSANLKPLTETDLDHLEHEAKAHSKMRSKKIMTQNISNAVQMDTEQIIESNMFENLVACNNGIGELDMPPIDREVTEVELDYLQQQHEISRLEFLEFEKKELEQQKKFRVNLEPETEPTDMEVMEQQDLTALEENNSEEFHIPPINRGATKVEDVYQIEKILSKGECEKILEELEENNYVADLHPYIKSYMKDRHLSPQLTVLAAYVSYLIKYLHASEEQIRMTKFKICPHSNTLNDILMKKFTKLAVIKSNNIQERIICHIMVFMLILNNYRFYLEPLCTAMGIPKRCSIKHLVYFTGASVVTSEIGRQVLLRLPLVKKPHSNSDKSTVCEDTDSCMQLKEEERLKISKEVIKHLVSKVQDETVTEQTETVTANDTVNNYLSIYGNLDLDDFYLPSINRDAGQVEHVYLVEKILSKDEYEHIYNELMENNYTADLHPYILPFTENETLSLQSTVLALYTSELIKFLHVDEAEIMKNDFVLCHCSKTLNNIIMNHFRIIIMFKHRSLQNMKDKIICHIIVFTLILSKFSFKLMPLLNSINSNRNHVMKMIAFVGASIINKDSEMTVQLKLPLVPKPQARIRKTKPHKIDKNLQHKDDYEIDPDEFYVPFLNREATNLEDVYVINKIFSEDEYFQIFFELAENNYMADLHPYIQQCVKTRTLSLEFTVLAVYASVLIKFLHTRFKKIKKFIICPHSKTLNAILFKRFTELIKYKGRTYSMHKTSQAMRRKILCHIIVCMLILNKFQFKMDSFLDAIKRKRILKLLSFVAATLEDGDDGTMVKLKLPLVPKTRATIHRNKCALRTKMDSSPKKKKSSSSKRKKGDQEAETVKIDPDDFYLPTIDRKATELEDVYPIEEILSKDEYEIIYQELQQNDYKDHLHPYILSFIENKTLPLQLIVLAVYANELLQFLKDISKVWEIWFRISNLSNKLNDICKKRFIVKSKIVENVTQDIRDKMVCHIIVFLLIINNFRFKLEDFCNAIKNTYKTKHVEKVVSLVGAVIVNKGEGSLIELKLPLVPKKEDITNNTSKRRLTVDRDLKKYEKNVVDPDDLLNTQNNISGASKIGSLQHIEKESLERETENVDQDDLSDNENIKDADDVYLPPINRKATKLEDVYPLEKFLSKDTYKKIECELKDSNYKKDLHPYIQSFVKKKYLSSELTVLAVCASSLIKHVNSLWSEIKKRDYRICPYSKTLNDILIKGFIELAKYPHKIYNTYKTVRLKSANMEIKSVCYIMICVLILNNFNFKLDPLKDALNRKCGFRFMLEAVRLVGAIIEHSDDGTVVKLQLPSELTQPPLKPLDRKIDLSKYDIIDPDDFYVPPINREATELENVYLMDKFFSKSKYKKIYCELKKSKYSEDLHPYIQSIIENKSLSLQFTVLAVYASELIKFIHVRSSKIRIKYFKVCHHSKTLNNIIMKGFTECSERKSDDNGIYTYRFSSPDMKRKIVCHVIVCVLILNNFQCNLDPLVDAVKRNVQETVRLVGASIVNGDNGKMVQLKLPLVPKPQITRKKQSTKIC